jgi:hypothetical protein
MLMGHIRASFLTAGGLQNDTRPILCDRSGDATLDFLSRSLSQNPSLALGAKAIMVHGQGITVEVTKHLAATSCTCAIAAKQL